MWTVIVEIQYRNAEGILKYGHAPDMKSATMTTEGIEQVAIDMTMSKVKDFWNGKMKKGQSRAFRLIVCRADAVDATGWVHDVTGVKEICYFHLVCIKGGSMANSNEKFKAMVTKVVSPSAYKGDA